MKKYILFIFVLPTKVFPFTNHVFEIFPKELSLKYYSITKFKYFSFEMNSYVCVCVCTLLKEICE
jgi:hypothetical protein